MRISLICLFLVWSSFSPIIAEAIINGVRVNDDKFLAVGSLWAGKGSTDPCTATLIAANWIVTARHCTQAITGSYEEGTAVALPASGYQIFFGQDSMHPRYKVSLKRWVYAPDDGTLDFALGELATAVPVEKLAIKIIPPLFLEWSPKDQSTLYEFIGFGQHQAFDSSPSWYGQQQKAEFSVTTVAGNAMLTIFKSIPAFASYLKKFQPDINLDEQPIETLLAHADQIMNYSVHAWDPRGRQNLNEITKPANGWQDTCFGDSGGPLIRSSDGRNQIVGVVSHGTDGTCATLGSTFIVFGPMIQQLISTLVFR